MKAYSQDLRQRVVHAVDEGRPRTEIVQLFGVSLATIKRYLKQRREIGHLSPKPIPGRPARKGDALQMVLKTQLEAYPDATLEEHCRLWETEHGIQVSTATMSRAIRQMNWTRKKKTLAASERNEAARTTWREQACQLESDRLVFCGRMWLSHCAYSIVCTGTQRQTSGGEGAPQLWSQYHVDRFTLAAGHGRSSHPGGGR